MTRISLSHPFPPSPQDAMLTKTRKRKKPKNKKNKLTTQPRFNIAHWGGELASQYFLIHGGFMLQTERRKKKSCGPNCDSEMTNESKGIVAKQKLTQQHTCAIAKNFDGRRATAISQMACHNASSRKQNCLGAFIGVAVLPPHACRNRCRSRCRSRYFLRRSR